MLATTMKGLSDHQVLEMVETMLSDDHRPSDSTATYLAAYAEARTRPQVWTVLTAKHPNLED